MDWLIAHQADVRLGFLLAALALLLVWEMRRPQRRLAAPLGSRWFNQIALLALGSLAVRWGAPIATVAFAILAQQEGWGLLNVVALPPWIAVVLGVVAMDLALYIQHRLFHAVPLLWRFHQIHHCDLDVDVGTAFRHHPVETYLGQAFDLAVIVAVGVPPLAVLAYVLLGFAAAMFNHANIMLRPVANRALRWILVTPDMHRIHHSVETRESNRNFANLFPWWDYLASTYMRDPHLGHAQMTLGVAEVRGDNDLSLWKLLALPFRRRRGAALDIALRQPEASR